MYFRVKGKVNCSLRMQIRACLVLFGGVMDDGTKDSLKQFCWLCNIYLTEEVHILDGGCVGSLSACLSALSS